MHADKVTLLQWCSVYLSGVLFQMKVHKFYFFHLSLLQSLEKKLFECEWPERRNKMKSNYFLNELNESEQKMQPSITWSFECFVACKSRIEWEWHFFPLILRLPAFQMRKHSINLVSIKDFHSTTFTFHSISNHVILDGIFLLHHLIELTVFL